MTEALPPIENRAATLIERWLDETATGEEITEMESVLLESAAARREFWRRAVFHGELCETARMAFAVLPGNQPPVPQKIARFSSGPLPRTWHSLLASGLVIAGVSALLGSLAASLALAKPEPSAASRVVWRLLDFTGFESADDPEANYIPSQTGQWGGDETTVIQGSGQQGITPKSGASMLQFLSGHPSGENYQANAAEIWRFIDLTPLRKEAGGESLTVEYSAWFNSVRPVKRNWPSCGLSIVATCVPPTEWTNQLWEKTSPFDHSRTNSWQRPLATAAGKQRLDDDLRSWQPVTTMLAVPDEATYLLLHCYVADYSDAASTAAFPGQYVDDIEVRVTTGNRYGIGRTPDLP